MPEIGDQIAELTREIRRLADTRDQSNPDAKAADGGRYAAALDGSKAVADALVATEMAKEDTDRKAQKALIAEEVRLALSEVREPSKAAAIGTARDVDPATGSMKAQLERNRRSWLKAHPFFAENFGEDYVPGDFAVATQLLRGNPDEYAIGKAMLGSLGVERSDVPDRSVTYATISGEGKATLGATGATGGYVLPNNLVEGLIKPSTMRAVYTGGPNPLFTIRNGVSVRGVDQPFRTGTPARAQFQDWGATKENVNEAYGSYTATLGTIARIYDIGKQYLRFSGGSAEADVMDELAKAFALGENYYAIAGAGTGSVGSGDPTLGVYTALNARPGFKAAFASASNSTVAGSFAAACSTLMQNVAANFREITAIVVDSTTYFTATRQGSDTAGFWGSDLLGAGFTFGTNVGQIGGGSLQYRGVPIYWDGNLGTNAATKIAIGAQWDAFKFYRGLEFRVDSSDVAGNRWDTNLVGYRGEEEIGFHAGAGVEVGAAFLLTAVIP